MALSRRLNLRGKKLIRQSMFSVASRSCDGIVGKRAFPTSRSVLLCFSVFLFFRFRDSRGHLGFNHFTSVPTVVRAEMARETKVSVVGTRSLKIVHLFHIPEGTTPPDSRTDCRQLHGNLPSPSPREHFTGRSELCPAGPLSEPYVEPATETVQRCIQFQTRSAVDFGYIWLASFHPGASPLLPPGLQVAPNTARKSSITATRFWINVSRVSGASSSDGSLFEI